MRSYEEVAERVLQRRDDFLHARKKQRKQIIVTLCCALLIALTVLGIGQILRAGSAQPTVNRSPFRMGGLKMLTTMTQPPLLFIYLARRGKKAAKALKIAPQQAKQPTVSPIRRVRQWVPAVCCVCLITLPSFRVWQNASLRPAQPEIIQSAELPTSKPEEETSETLGILSGDPQGIAHLLLSELATPTRIDLHGDKRAKYTPEDEAFWQILALNAARDTGVRKDASEVKGWEIQEKVLMVYYFDDYSPIYFFLGGNSGELFVEIDDNKNYAYYGLGSSDELLAYLKEVTK